MALLLIVFSLLGFTISLLFNLNLLGDASETEDITAKERLKIRNDIFQTQIFYLSIFFGLIGALVIIFPKRIVNLLNHNRELLMNILLLVVILIFLMVLMEIGLRIFFSQQIYEEYGFGPGTTEFHKNMKYNSLGFRDIEHNINKDKKTFRILVIGDSFTVGYGIDNPENVYTRVLQKKLDDTYVKYKFEVITLANGGYTTIDAVRTLKSLGLNFSPDLIILGYYANDVEGPDSMIGFEKMFFHHYLLPYEVGYWFYRNSFAYYFLESRFKNLLVSFGMGGDTYKDYISHLYSDSNPAFKEHKDYLSDFIKLGKNENIQVIVMNIPVISDFENYPFYYVDNYIENINLLKGSIYINLLPHFSIYNPDQLRVSFLDTHMNELGHNITANVIFNEIEDRGLIGNVE